MIFLIRRRSRFRPRCTWPLVLKVKSLRPRHYFYEVSKLLVFDGWPHSKTPYIR